MGGALLAASRCFFLPSASPESLFSPPTFTASVFLYLSLYVLLLTSHLLPSLDTISSLSWTSSHPPLLQFPVVKSSDGLVSLLLHSLSFCLLSFSKNGQTKKKERAVDMDT